MSLQEKILKRKLKKKEKQKLKVIEDRKTAKLEETEEDSQVENESSNENESKGLKRELEDSENNETPAPPVKKKKKKSKTFNQYSFNRVSVSKFQDTLLNLYAIKIVFLLDFKNIWSYVRNFQFLYIFHPHLAGV